MNKQDYKTMKKEEWETWYKRYREIFDEYYFAEQDYKQGKNKKIRETASQKIDILIGRAKNYAESDMEIYRLIEYPEEMFSFQFFKGDLQQLLSKIKNKCND